MHKRILAAALAFGCSAVPAAFATDLPYGGDALYHQLRASSDVALARLTARRQGLFEFRLLENLKGDLPPDFTVNAKEPGLSWVRAGGEYLLFLNPSQGSGADLELATSYYSIQSVRRGDRRLYREAVAAYLRNVSDKVGLKPELRRLAGSPLPYLQYSAVVDLKRLGLIQSGDLPWLADLVTRRVFADSRTRGIVVQQIGRFRARRFTGLLEGVVRDKQESVSVRADALSTLQQLGATESLKTLAPIVAKSPGLRYKTIVRQKAEAERLKRSSQP